MTQFVNCGFTPGTRRLYAYRNDGEPLQPGDFVKVEGKGADKTIEVVEILDEAPPFECKAVLGKAERPDGWPVPETLL